MTPIVRFEQINHRGEASRPRVDLIALGQLLDRAAQAVGMHRYELAAALGTRPPEGSALERDLIAALREVRSVRTRSRRRVPCDRIRRR